MSPAPGWKRRARSDGDFARKAGKKPAQPLVLIVCEDSKSSPGYFRDLKTHLRIVTIGIEICGKECGSAPISVVDFAIALRDKRKKKGHTIDVTFCVVDVDSHKTLAKGKDKAGAHGLEFIVSSPCFELWYLVHFELGDRPYDKCGPLISALKQYLPSYEKGSSRLFQELLPKVETAIENARRLCTLRADDPERTSYTEIHILVERLRALVTPPVQAPAPT